MIFCCFSISKSCLTLCDPMDCSTQASLSVPISWGLLKFVSIQLVMLSNHLILCCPLSSCPQSFPASGSVPKIALFASGSVPKIALFASGGQTIGAYRSDIRYICRLEIYESWWCDSV